MHNFYPLKLKYVYIFLLKKKKNYISIRGEKYLCIIFSKKNICSIMRIFQFFFLFLKITIIKFIIPVGELNIFISLEFMLIICTLIFNILKKKEWKNILFMLNNILKHFPILWEEIMICFSRAIGYSFCFYWTQKGDYLLWFQYILF